MIHTDGRPTIANAPQRSVTGFCGVTAESVATLVPLLEREHSGVRVELHYLGGQCYVRVEDADGLRFAPVPGDKALEAFEHPYLYVA